MTDDEAECMCGHIFDEHAAGAACEVEGCRCVHFDPRFYELEDE